VTEPIGYTDLSTQCEAVAEIIEVMIIGDARNEVVIWDPARGRILVELQVSLRAPVDSPPPNTKIESGRKSASGTLGFETGNCSSDDGRSAHTA
jgi:hypothetical protein